MRLGGLWGKEYVGMLTTSLRGAVATTSEDEA